MVLLVPKPPTFLDCEDVLRYTTPIGESGDQPGPVHLEGIHAFDLVRSRSLWQ